MPGSIQGLKLDVSDTIIVTQADISMLGDQPEKQLTNIGYKPLTRERPAGQNGLYKA
jgi:hypothetical protein